MPGDCMFDFDIASGLVIDGDADQSSVARLGEKPGDSSSMQAETRSRFLLRETPYVIEPRHTGYQCVVCLMSQVDV